MRLAGNSAKVQKVLSQTTRLTRWNVREREREAPRLRHRMSGWKRACCSLLNPNNAHSSTPPSALPNTSSELSHHGSQHNDKRHSNLHATTTPSARTSSLPPESSTLHPSHPPHLGDTQQVAQSRSDRRTSEDNRLPKKKKIKKGGGRAVNRLYIGPPPVSVRW